MKQIEELLKEYSIRFNVTDKIKEKGYPFAPLSYRINRDRATPDVRDGYLCNEQGIVYENGVWATADVKEKPEKWVVEKDEGNPLWEKFKEWFGFNLKDNGLFGFRYIGGGSPRLISNDLLYFKNHQYLTLDQWAELFLPKEEFSNGQIVYEDGRIMIMKGDGRKFHVLYDSRKEAFPLTKGFCIDSEYGEEDSCLDFRPATKEEKQTLFNRLEEVGKKWNPKTLQIEDLEKIGNCADCLTEIYLDKCDAFRNSKNEILCPLCYVNHLILKGVEMYFTDVNELKKNCGL